MALPLPRMKRKPPPPPDGQMELLEHLGELRTRIFRSILYVAVGMVVTYNLFPYLYELLYFPLRPVYAGIGGEIMIKNIADGFLLRMQVCLVSGLAVAVPFVILELWGFIAPALTPEERKPVKYLAPFSVLLFVAGLATGYASLPTAFGWMASYIKDIPTARLMQDAQQYIVLTVKIMLAFGISFQLPLVLLFLARVGVITASLMTTYWRHATVGISVLAAVLTPSNDPLTMLMMAVPMAGLYLLSIGLVRAFEPKADGTRTGPPLSTMLLVALAPIAIILAVGFWLSRSIRINSKPVPPAARFDPATGDKNIASPPDADKGAVQGNTTPATPDDIKTLRDTLNLQQQQIVALQKQIDDMKATPAPQPSPEASPETVPQTNPEASPQASPQTDPTASPEASPQANPQASPEAGAQTAP